MKKILFGVLSLFLLLPNKSLAFNVTPASADLILWPGETTEEIIEINEDEVGDDYEVLFYLVEFATNADEFSFKELGREYDGWFKAEPAKFTLSALDKKEVKIKINTPSDALDQAFTVAVVVRELENGMSGVDINRAPASLLFLHLGQLETQAYLTSLAPHKRLIIGDKVRLRAEFVNYGTDTALLPHDFRVNNLSGREVALFSDESGKLRLPPKTNRLIETEWSVPAKVLFAKYYFELYEGQRVFGTTSVVVITPFGLLVFILTSVIIGILMATWFYFKRIEQVRS